MEPRLSKQSEILLAKLKKDKQLLTLEQYEFLRKAMLLQESWGMVSRFVIGLAGFIGATIAVMNIWPWSGR